MCLCVTFQMKFFVIISNRLNITNANTDGEKVEHGGIKLGEICNDILKK